MTSPVFHSSAPVVGVGRLDLARLSGGISDPLCHWQRFSLPVAWLREASAKVRLTHRGVVVKDVSTWVDTHAFLGCIESAIEAAMSAATHYRITPDSDLVAQVDVEVTDRPVVRAPEEDSRILSSPAYRGLNGAPSSAAWHADLVLMDEAWNEASPAGRQEILGRLTPFCPEPRRIEWHEGMWSTKHCGAGWKLHEDSEVILEELKEKTAAHRSAQEQSSTQSVEE